MSFSASRLYLYQRLGLNHNLNNLICLGDTLHFEAVPIVTDFCSMTATLVWKGKRPMTTLLTNPELLDNDHDLRKDSVDSSSSSSIDLNIEDNNSFYILPTAGKTTKVISSELLPDSSVDFLSFLGRSWHRNGGQTCIRKHWNTLVAAKS